MTKLFKSINISLVAAIIMILATALNLAEEVRLTTVIGVTGNDVRGAFGVVGNPLGGSWLPSGNDWRTYNPGNDWLVVGQGLSVGYTNPPSTTFSVNGTALITDTVTLVQGLNVTNDVDIGMDLSVDGRITTSGTISGDRIWMSNDLLFANAHPGGRVVWNGQVWWLGGNVIHADYVFEPDYKLETIEEHAKFMWKEKRLPAIPVSEKTNNGRYRTEIGGQQRGILAELEKAHIYITQLKEMLYKLKKRVTRLENKYD